MEADAAASAAAPTLAHAEEATAPPQPPPMVCAEHSAGTAYESPDAAVAKAPPKVVAFATEPPPLDVRSGGAQAARFVLFSAAVASFVFAAAAAGAAFAQLYELTINYTLWPVAFVARTLAMGVPALLLLALSFRRAWAAQTTPPGVLLLGQLARVAAGAAAAIYVRVLERSLETPGTLSALWAGAAFCLLIPVAAACVWCWGGWWPPHWPPPLAAALGDPRKGAPRRGPSTLGRPLAAAAGAGLVLLTASMAVTLGGALARAATDVGERAEVGPVLLVRAASVLLAAFTLARGGCGRLAAVAMLASVDVPSWIFSGFDAVTAGAVIATAGAAASIVGLSVLPRGVAAAAPPLNRGARVGAAACLVAAAAGIVPAAVGLPALASAHRRLPMNSDELSTHVFAICMVAAALPYAAWVVAAAGPAGGAARHRLAAAGLLMLVQPLGTSLHVLREIDVITSWDDVSWKYMTASSAGFFVTAASCIGAACVLAAVTEKRAVTRRGGGGEPA